MSSGMHLKITYILEVRGSTPYHGAMGSSVGVVRSMSSTPCHGALWGSGRVGEVLNIPYHGALL